MILDLGISIKINFKNHANEICDLISCVYIKQCKMASNMATSRNYKINLVDLEMNLLYLYLVKAAINCVEMNTSLFYKPKLLVCFTSIGIFLLLNFKRLELDISISFTFKNLP